MLNPFSTLNASDLVKALGAELQSAGVPAAEEIITAAVQKVLGSMPLEAYLDTHKIVVSKFEVSFEPK